MNRIEWHRTISGNELTMITIELGSGSTLVKLFSYPNKPGTSEPLVDTILHWINQMLARDGFSAKGVTASVFFDDQGKYCLRLEGPKGVDMDLYAERLPVFLKNGTDALAVVKSVKKMKRKGSSIPGTSKKNKAWPDWVQPPLADKLWDPQNTGTWRFFLPWGMGMVNQVTLNFFHYPPMRLLDQMRDYLDDPVPVRLIELMNANGVKSEEEAWLYSTVMDGAPIAAPDDQGTIYKSKTDFSDPVHLIPIDQFPAYQKAQTELLLNDFGNSKYTIPIVVYGSSARKSFNSIWNAGLSPNSKPATHAEVVKGKKTAVLCSGHPYAFFAQVQEEVGAGSMLPEKWPNAVETMIHDLAVIRWQINLSKDASKDPAVEWRKCLEYWNDSKQLQTVYQLVMHQGTLWYPDPRSLEFTFRLTMEDVAERAHNAAKSVLDARQRAAKNKANGSSKKSSGQKKSSKKKRA